MSISDRSSPYDESPLVESSQQAGLFISTAMTDIIDELAQGVAQALDERGKSQITQIRRLIECLGAKAVLTYAEQAKAIDKQAAILVCRGHRFRTVGGIFYLLARDDPKLTDETRLYCYRFERYARMTKAPDDESEASAQSFEKNGTMGDATPLYHEDAKLSIA